MRRYLFEAAPEDVGRRGKVTGVYTNDRMIGATLALCGFAVAMLAGLFAGNDTTTVLTRAIIAMVCCRLVGSLIGMIYGHASAEHVNRYRSAHPIPGKSGPARGTIDAAGTPGSEPHMEIARAA